MNKKVLSIVVLCSLVGIALTVLVTYLLKGHDNSELVDISVNENLSPENVGQDATQTTLEDTHTVTFYSPDGTLLKIADAADGEYVVPPEDINSQDTQIFTGWSEDTSPDQVETAYEASYIDVGTTQNALAVPSAYSVYGMTFSVPIRICGQVELCAVDLKLEYDQTKIEFCSFENIDEDVIANCDTLNGIIYLNYISMANTTGGLDMCDITFKVIAQDYQETSIAVNVTEILRLESDGTFITPDFTAIDAAIYLNSDMLKNNDNH